MNPRGSKLLNRRKFLKKTGKAALGGIAISSLAEERTVPRLPDSQWSRVRGFNYQPSYGSNGFELWQDFNASIIERELKRGKKYFPKINALRWWQSWDSFLRDPALYSRNFEKTLDLAEKIGCKVMPCLFNRWHDCKLDYGGIYIDHFLPDASWIQKGRIFDGFLKALVGEHKDDPRILAWDLCNEPYAYSCPHDRIPKIVDAETQWLKDLYATCKSLGAKAPITVGIHGTASLSMINPFSDILSIHPYWMHNGFNADKTMYESGLNEQVDFALKVGKPLCATECCWGDINDAKRVENIRYTLSELRKRNIGWTVYLLHHSLIADAHRPEFGPLGDPGNLAFIEEDGSLRPGHDVFNNF